MKTKYLQIIEITDVSNPDFKEALKIYIDSFPANERQAPSVIEKRVADKVSRLLVGKWEDKVNCMALLYELKNEEFILLEYLGTDANYRSKGLGSKMMGYISKVVEKLQKTLIIEVENPNFGKNREEKERRIRFYKRVGAKLLKGVRYVVPPLDGSEPIEMNLMFLPNYGNGKIPGAMLQEVIAQIYEEIYNRPRSDQLLQSFINDISETVELE
ncbi:MAG: GNAT family N-acetyltransferase [Oscillatoriaceae bacterium SKW80]|nr:GNAT family N-acetyltransferase [Oscillatoriaceae bacterium SKYG93]MCX8120092.1 GNAT family N-acetyltransferase [Oscillatoriaceae bacterium SKW80]MDW8453018.1 GNAT family N-acetyltransferase [Oscillatoriaceae cyanobacterium SKYGB_i_bin93]HIK29071.1 GNAT family N-acetyltransferase [Oscillatoriaceae cyanobacterium M7585_C2015_266]